MAADAQRQVPIFDFKVISDGSDRGHVPGDPWVETVWKEDPPDSWGHGEELGKVTIHALGPQGSPAFWAEFDFGKKYPDVWVRGTVPNGQEWRGTAKAKAKGAGRERDDVDVEFVNPKRWG